MEIWTGVACLVANPDCKDFRRFGDHGKGAYVNVVAWANSEQQFVESVRQIAQQQLDCILTGIEYIRPLEIRMAEPDYPEELIEMRATAQRQPKDVVFGTFHTWQQSEVN